MVQMCVWQSGSLRLADWLSLIAWARLICWQFIRAVRGTEAAPVDSNGMRIDMKIWSYD